MSPSFSVVIPLFNKAPYVVNTIYSVLAQGYEALEIIVIDDGSSDGGADILRSIDDKRLSIISQENSGASKARNVGIALATGQWIAFLDGDDYWHQDHLAELCEIILAFPAAGLVSTYFTEAYQNDISRVTSRLSNSKGNFEVIDYLSTTYDGMMRVCSSCVAVKKSIFDELGGFDETLCYGEDTELWTRIALHYPVAVSTRVTSVYVKNTGGLMDTLASQNRKRSPIPNQLEDLSPALTTVFKYSKIHPGTFDRPEIRNHINGRIIQGVRSYLYMIDIESAKELAALALPHSRKSCSPYLLINWIPNFILYFSVLFYKKIKYFFKLLR